MSYDLLIFDPTIAPRERSEFMLWYELLTNWDENRDYNSPENTPGHISAFYDHLRKDFPPMNGPDAYDFDQPTPSFNEDLITDYCIAKKCNLFVVCLVRRGTCS